MSGRNCCQAIRKSTVEISDQRAEQTVQVLKEELEWWKIKAERAEKSILKNKLLFATAGEKGKAETEKTESWSHGMDRFLLALCKQHTTVLTKRKSYEEKLKRVYDDINRQWQQYKQDFNKQLSILEKQLQKMQEQKRKQGQYLESLQKQCYQQKQKNPSFFMKELKRIEESINLELKYFVDRAKGIWETILFIFKAEKALPVKIKEKFGAVLQFLRDKMFKQTIPIKVFGVLQHN